MKLATVNDYKELFNCNDDSLPDNFTQLLALANEMVSQRVGHRYDFLIRTNSNPKVKEKLDAAVVKAVCFQTLFWVTNDSNPLEASSSSYKFADISVSSDTTKPNNDATKLCLFAFNTLSMAGLTYLGIQKEDRDNGF